MFFGSDNTGPAHPAIMQSVMAANQNYTPSYGADPLMQNVTAKIRDIFEAPKAAVYLVATGTAANALILGTLANPWDSIFCHRVAHIEEDECGAPEFYTGGAKLALINGDHGKMSSDALAKAIAFSGGKDVHRCQPGPVSISNVTELGTVYSLEEIRALTAIAKANDLPTHLDGARFANAMVALGCSAADLSWKSGIDAVSFGGTKNGCIGVEAVIFFDPRHAWEFELRRKRGAHLFSKHRFLSAQMHAYLNDGLWLTLARAANAAGQRLAKGMGKFNHVEIPHPVDANMIFAKMPRDIHRRAKGGGAVYGINGPIDGDGDEMLGCRLVTDWSSQPEAADDFLKLLHA